MPPEAELRIGSIAGIPLYDGDVEAARETLARLFGGTTTFAVDATSLAVRDLVLPFDARKVDSPLIAVARRGGSMGVGPGSRRVAAQAKPSSSGPVSAQPAVSTW